MRAQLFLPNHDGCYGYQVDSRYWLVSAASTEMKKRTVFSYYETTDFVLS